MTWLEWCDHCQRRTAHHHVQLPGGVIWVGNVRHTYPPEWMEYYCARCNAHKMEWIGH